MTGAASLSAPVDTVIKSSASRMDRMRLVMDTCPPFPMFYINFIMDPGILDVF
jgi:hypothetical protein